MPDISAARVGAQLAQFAYAASNAIDSLASLSRFGVR